MNYDKLIVVLLLTITSSIALENATLANRILNGQVAGPIPFQAGLFYGPDGNPPYCSAVVINDTFLLTAASCVDRKDLGLLYIRAGFTDSKSNKGTRHSILEYRIHENFQPNLVNNLALMKIYPQLVFDRKTIAPIALSANKVYEGYRVILSGWGAVNMFGSESGRYLRKAEALTVSTVRCQQQHKQVTFLEMCTSQRFRGACKGDAGGAVTNLDANELVAIISLGDERCTGRRYNVHTRISEYTPWIEKKLGEVWPEKLKNM